MKYLPFKNSMGLVFRVPGLPVPSGSRRVVPVRRDDGSRTYRLVADKRVSDWVATVRTTAERAMKGDPPWDGPLWVNVEFFFPRPMKHYRGGKRSNPLREDAPRYMSRRPDLDKLVRAVLDALTGVVYLDDAQAAFLQSRKSYVNDDGPHVLVSVSVLGRL